MKRTVFGTVSTLFLVGMLVVFDAYQFRAEGLSSRVYLDPSDYRFNTYNGTIGTRFNVTARVDNVADLAAFQVKIYFNDTIINVTRWFEPTWTTEYVFYGRSTLPAPTPPSVAYQHVGPGNGSAMVSVTLFPFPLPGQGFTGSGKLSIIEFEITAIPAEQEKLSCFLHVNNPQTFLLDSLLGEISASKEDGYYELTWVMEPKPYVTTPLNGSLIYGTGINVTAVEINLASNLVSTTFEYAPAQTGPWTLIGIDTNPWDGWRVFWNLTSLTEGGYYVRATMLNSLSLVGEDLAYSYFDPTPPIPEMLTVGYPTIARGLTDLEAITFDENVVVANFSLFEDGWVDCNWIEKEVPGLPQDSFNDDPNDPLPNWQDGKYSCGPAAAAQCLAYWDNQPGCGNLIGVGESIETMARALYKGSKTNQQNRDGKPGLDPGTYDDDLETGIKNYINAKGLANKLVTQLITGKDASLSRAINEFLSCQDVILLVKTPGQDETPNTPDDQDHYVTLSSVHFEYLVDKSNLELWWVVYTDVDFMEPGDGQKTVGAIDWENGRIKADWFINGNVGQNEYASLISIITVCPKSSGCILIGSDTNGSDGWSVSWDTTQLPDAFYLVKVNMTDATGYTGTDLMLVYVNNARVIEVDPTKPVVGQGCPIDIRVSIENLHVEPVFFNITLYGNETMIEKKSIFLANHSSTTLTFTWNTTSFPKGNYTMSALATRVFDATHKTNVTRVAEYGIFISIVGDINADRKVDLKDIYAVGKAFGTTRQGPNPPGRVYVPNCDINDDGKIDLKDYYTTCKNYGKSW